MGREGNGVRQVSNTSIQIEFIYRGERCRERIKFNPSTTPVDVALKKAELHRVAITSAIIAGTFDYTVTFPGSKQFQKIETSSDLTVGQWLKTCLDEKEAHLKSSSFDSYTKQTRQLTTAFGHIKLADLRKEQVRDWCKSKKISNKTISNIISPLRSALQSACELDLIPINPLTNFKFKRTEAPSEDKELDPFTVEEEALILLNSSGHTHNLIQFAFWTGMRTSEMVALTWEDIDFKGMRIHIKRAKTQKATIAEKTKTYSGKRIVRLLSPAYDALMEQRKLTGPKGVIFLNPHDSRPWKGDQPIRRAFVLICRNAEVRYRRPYQTRHTFASRMLSAGESLRWLSHHLGHSTITQTEKAYAKYIEGTHPDAGEKGVDLFKRT